jgi:hypothetical protein
MIYYTQKIQFLYEQVSILFIHLNNSNRILVKEPQPITNAIRIGTN